MNETKIRTGTFKYINRLQTGQPCLIDMIVGGVRYSVPIKPTNNDYVIIKRLSDAGIINIADAD